MSDAESAAQLLEGGALESLRPLLVSQHAGIAQKAMMALANLTAHGTAAIVALCGCVHVCAGGRIRDVSKKG